MTEKPKPKPKDPEQLHESVMPWKRLWARAEQLKGQIGAKAYELAEVLITLSRDEEFAADNGLLSEFAVYDKLSEFTKDHLGMTFEQLRTVREYHTDRARWIGESLWDLLGEAEAATSRADAGERAPAVQRQRIKLADHKETVEQRDRFKARSRELKSQLDEAREEIAALRGEVSSLRAENEQLRSENAELRRIVSQPDAVCA